METYEFVSRVFTMLGQDLVKICTSDLLIDLPRAVRMLNEGKKVYVLSRKTGSDLYERFEEAMMEDNKPKPSRMEVYKYTNSSLGFYVETILSPDFTVEIRLNDTDDRKSGWYGVTNRGLERFDRKILYDKEKEDPVKRSVVFSRDDYDRLAKDIAWFAQVPVKQLN